MQLPCPNVRRSIPMLLDVFKSRKSLVIGLGLIINGSKPKAASATGAHKLADFRIQFGGRRSMLVHD
ncbi:MAG: hypothetical protein ABL962_02340 [Fimbriimonadaceae bacterium]